MAKNRIWVPTLMILALVAGGVAAQHQPATPSTQPAGVADPGELIVTKLRVQDLPAITYFYIPTETTLERIGETVQEIMPKMLSTIQENRVNITGPGEFVYHGVTQDPTKPFQLEIGFPVAEGTKEAGDCKVRKLEAFHCASVIYSGPVAQVGQAYQQLFTELFAAGMQPTGETREMYLYWESPESANNIELIMAGVQ